MAKWKKRGIYIDPLFEMKCLGCKDPIARFVEIAYVLSNFPLDSNKPSQYSSYVIDRTFLCNLCGFRHVFGVALSKEHFTEIIEHESKKDGTPSDFGWRRAYEREKDHF